MSYARFGPLSDVYVYRDVEGGWTAHWPGGAENLPTPAALRVRLLELRAAGFRVPVACLRRVEMDLRAERREPGCGGATTKETP